MLRAGAAGPARLTAVDRAALATWGWTRVATYVVALVAAPLVTAPPAPGWLERWRQWDVRHFEAIAAAGYGQDRATPYEAFFPGLPMLLRALGRLGMDLTAAGLLVSAVGGAVAVVALARLGGPAVGPRAVLLLTLSPPAVFLAAGYTEAVFLGLALPAWLAATRGQWWLAGALAAGAATMRVSGLFLAAALVVHWSVSRPRRARDAPALVLPVLPPLAYMAWLRVTTGDWFAWLTAQRVGWYRELTDPLSAWQRTWGAAFGGAQPPAEALVFRGEIAAVIVGVLLTGWLLRRRAWGEATFVGLQVGALATSTWYFSVPRAALLWWPLWLLLARLTLRRPWTLAAYLAVAAPLAVLWTLAFTTGRWSG